MSTFKDVFEIECICIKETPKAILIDIDGLEHWIAKSQIDDFSEVFEEGDEGRLVINEWLAKKIGLIFNKKTNHKTNGTSKPLPNEIYKKLALKYHPDKHPETAEVMKDINELYQSLKKG